MTETRPDYLTLAEDAACKPPRPFRPRPPYRGWWARPDRAEERPGERKQERAK